MPQRVRVSLPIGTVFQTMITQQSNWLLCNGDPVDGQFPDLRNIMNNTPDLRPRDTEGNLFQSYTPGEFLSGYGTYVPFYVIAKI